MTSKQSSKLVLFRAYLRACKILFCNTIHLQDFKEVCSNDQGISNKAERAFTWSFTSSCVLKLFEDKSKNKSKTYLLA